MKQLLLKEFIFIFIYIYICIFYKIHKERRTYCSVSPLEMLDIFQFWLRKQTFAFSRGFLRLGAWTKMQCFEGFEVH